jgi:hypothetical protein
LLGAQTDFASFSALPLAFSAVHSGIFKTNSNSATQQKKAKAKAKAKPLLSVAMCFRLIPE